MFDQIYQELQVRWAAKLFIKMYEKWYKAKPGEIKLFHYTSTEVMDKILGNATFRASNIFYLNDSKEYREGVESLKPYYVDLGIKREMLEELSKNDGRFIAGPYTVSFSLQENSLHQWITYAKESGVALELDYELINSSPQNWLIAQKFEDEQEQGVIEIEMIKPLTYRQSLETKLETICKSVEIEEHEEVGTKAEKELIERLALQMLVSYIKNEKFNGESEVRIAAIPMEICKQIDLDKEKKLKTVIQYYPTGGILRPYLDLVFKHVDDMGKQHSVLPLKSIIVGPSGKQQIVFDSVVHRVTYGKKQVYQYGLEDIKKHLDALGEMIQEKYAKDEYVNAFKASWLDDNMKPLCERFGKNEEEIRGELGITETALAATDSAELVKTLDKIRHDFYMTSEGIIIHKSDIPYVF